MASCRMPVAAGLPGLLWFTAAAKSFIEVLWLARVYLALCGLGEPTYLRFGWWGMVALADVVAG